MYKLRFTILSIFLITTVFFSGCYSDDSGKPRSTGKTNMILVVTNTKDQWNNEIGQVIRTYFGRELPALPQPEPMFGFLNIADENLNDLYKKFHNILIVNIDPEWKGNVLAETKKDLWSYPQRVIKITAPDYEAFLEKFEEQKETYLDMFNKLERERVLKNFKMAQDIGITTRLGNKFGIYLEIPGGFYIAEEDEGFLWLRHTVQKVRQDIELGILIYTQDYLDTNVFDKDHIIALRDQITMEYVSGPSYGSYMKVADEFYEPVTRYAESFPADYAVETRGLWDVENDFMGGPFISYTFLDEHTNKVFTLDGYIYYPNEEKKNHLRELEAIFHSLRTGVGQEKN